MSDVSSEWVAIAEELSVLQHCIASGEYFKMMKNGYSITFQCIHFNAYSSALLLSCTVTSLSWCTYRMQKSMHYIARFPCKHVLHKILPGGNASSLQNQVTVYVTCLQAVQKCVIFIQVH